MLIPLTLRRTLQPTAQWLPVSLQAPQEMIQVRLVTPSRGFDVSTNNVVAALEPLTLGIGLDSQMQAALAATAAPELHFVDRSLGQVVGTLQLGKSGEWNTAGVLFGLFEVHSGAHSCAPWLRRAWDSWLYRRASRRNRRTGNFALPVSAVERTMIVYICPRPVFLVTVDDGQNNNIFPMDLVGPITPGRFSLALRNTSPSVETIKSARRVALASIPAADYPIAIQLGAHHKKSKIVWDELPFKVSRSREFGLPIPANALRVTEIAILDFQVVGSHTLFVGQIIRDEHRIDGRQLFHTCGIHQRLRTRQKQPLQAVSARAVP